MSVSKETVRYKITRTLIATSIIQHSYGGRLSMSLTTTTTTTTGRDVGAE